MSIDIRIGDRVRVEPGVNTTMSMVYFDDQPVGGIKRLAVVLDASEQRPEVSLHMHPRFHVLDPEFFSYMKDHGFTVLLLEAVAA